LPNAQFVKRCLAYIVEPITVWEVLFFSNEDGDDIAFAWPTAAAMGQERGVPPLQEIQLRGVEYGEVFWLDRS
jgi:hypothetical protein